MKKAIAISVIIVISLTLLSNINASKKPYTIVTAIEKLEIPDNIRIIIDKKCYDCHNNDSRGQKSKMKLNFDKFENVYSKGKIVSKLLKIKKVLAKEKMPPKKYLAKFPKQKLTPEETATLNNWVNNQIEELSKS